MRRIAGALGPIGVAVLAFGCRGSRPPDAVATELALAAAAMAINAATPKHGQTPVPHEPGCASGPDACGGGASLDVEDDLKRARARALTEINRLRATHDRAPLTADADLDDFAEDGSVQLARDHRPHGHLLAHSDGCAPCADVQGDPTGYAASALDDRLETILGDMADGAQGTPERDNLLASSWHRVGIGLVNPRGRLFVTLDFAP